MKKIEVYISFSLIVIVLFSVLIKKTLYPLKNNYTIENKIQYYQNEESKQNLKKGFIGKRKPNGRAWSEKFGKYLKEMMI